MNNDSFNVRAQGGARFVTGGAGMTIDGQPVLTTGSGLSAAQLNGTILSANLPNGIGGANNTASGSYATVAGGAHNIANAGEATVGGGSDNTANTAATVGGGSGNVASGNSATVGGGYFNHANGTESVVGGGAFNTANDNYATVSGGFGNEAAGFEVTVSGGFANEANAIGATVGGGLDNTNSGSYAVVPGGYENLAGGAYAFAAGEHAQATNNGAFVWSDSSGTTTASTADNSVTMRASGGFRLLSGAGTSGVFLAAGGTSWATISDQNAKKNFAPVNAEAVLAKLAQVPVEKWNYKWEKNGDTPNIGPMAQAFKAAFYPGRDNKSITTLEFDGVELAAIQGLNQKLEQKQTEITELKQQNDSLATRLAKLEQLVAAKIGGAQ